MKETIKSVLESAKTGTLSVIDFETGGPFGALVNVATDENGLPLFLFSKLARHTKSLLQNPAASLLVSERPPDGDPLTGFRATIVGQMAEIEIVPARYLTKHPYAETYVGFGDFNFWSMTPKKIYVVGGFGRIQSFDAAEVFN
jgi:heme iron utilization protein